MLRKRQGLPLDYSLCTMTVTVYHREGLTRQVMEGVHYEWTREGAVSGPVSQGARQFLLVVPGGADIRPGDKVVLGEGPEIESWARLNIGSDETLGVVASVKQRYFKGRLCHTEARG